MIITFVLNDASLKDVRGDTGMALGVMGDNGGIKMVYDMTSIMRKAHMAPTVEREAEKLALVPERAPEEPPPPGVDTDNMMPDQRARMNEWLNAFYPERLPIVLVPPRFAAMTPSACIYGQAVIEQARAAGQTRVSVRELQFEKIDEYVGQEDDVDDAVHHYASIMQDPKRRAIALQVAELEREANAPLFLEVDSDGDPIDDMARPGLCVNMN